MMGKGRGMTSYMSITKGRGVLRGCGCWRVGERNVPEGRTNLRYKCA